MLDDLPTIPLILRNMKPLLFLAILLLLSGCGEETKSSTSYSKDTAALRTVFPVLESDQVAAFRYQDWCKVLEYSRGSFANTTQSTCTYIASGSPTPFDSTAEADLERIWKKVKSTGAGVYVISNVHFDATGKLVRGKFDCSSAFVRQSYVYEPGYTLPDDLPNERWHVRVDSDWYYVQEDWN